VRTLVAVACLVATVFGPSVPAARAAAALPTQVFYLPMPLGPDPESDRVPVSVGMHEIEFPDARRGQIVRLDVWIPISRTQNTRLSMDYVGLEGQDRFRYGGGRLEAQFSQHFEGAWPTTMGLDVALTVPVGDPSLHPLSAKATALRFRLRGRVLGDDLFAVWLGGWGRLVSPPEVGVREAPRSGFPSAGGIDLHLGLRAAGWGVTAHGRHSLLGGAPEETTVRITLERDVTEHLAVRAGAGTSIAAQAARLADHLWSLELVWRPRVQHAPQADERRRR